MGRRVRRRTSSGNPEPKIVHTLEDRISQLPHDILVSILSVLTMKEAARTSTLSHRWRCLWTYIPGLNFDAQEKLRDLQLLSYESLKNYAQQYVKWVDQVIQSYNGPNLETLRIRFDLDSTYQCDIDRWVNFAIQWKLKIFELNLSCCYGSGQGETCSFPQLSNEPKEHLQRAIFSNSSPLTTLKLIAVNVSGEVLEGFLTNCRLLEVLCVQYSYCLVNLRVVGASLKLRHLEVYMCYRLKSLEISAPNLESFKYVGPSISMPLKNAPKLLETHFGSDFVLDIIDNFFLLSSYCSQLQKLVLDILLEAVESEEFEWPLLPNLKELELIVIGEGQLTLLGFTSLIEASPCLQKFSLKLDYLDMFEEREVETVTKCPHQHIKVVEFTGFVGIPIDLELVRYFYENAMALEKIVFDTRKPKYMGTIFEKKQNEETIHGRSCAEALRSLFPEIEVIII